MMKMRFARWGIARMLTGCGMRTKIIETSLVTERPNM